MTATIADASLSPTERHVLDRLVELLPEQLDVRSIWLYGSRARGEEPHEESDVDLLVVVPEAPFEASHVAHDVLHRVAAEVGISPWFFSIHVYDEQRIAQRREIKSFFIQEVDRDKIVLHGVP